MLNQFMIVGRVQSIINNILQVKIIGNVPTDTKILDIKVSDNIAKRCREYMKPEDLVGVHGKFDIDVDNLLIADKITFLSSHVQEDAVNAATYNE